ncbi:ribulose bisphosphate carboxylase small subunit, chloroplastic 1-like [Aegilops tauschii subsp. strangulata]
MAPAVMASSATTVAPFQGLKSTAGLPVSRRSSGSLGSVSNGGRIRCMQVWPIEGIKKFETLSYLPPLSTEALLKQVDYLIRSKWVPCLEFSKVGFVFREHNSSPGYYDGRYWTM